MKVKVVLNIKSYPMQHIEDFAVAFRFGQCVYNSLLFEFIVVLVIL